MFAWLLNLAYSVLLLALSPALLYRIVVHGKYRDGWGAKFCGWLPTRSTDNPCVWFHAVSVGEVLQLHGLVAQLKKCRPDLDVVISTTTSTGLSVAKKRFPGDWVCYFPLDFSWAVRRALARIRPDIVVLVELELWPNFILQADRQRIPLALINARISENSFRGYKLFRPVMRRLLSRFAIIAAQSETYRSRLLALGAPHTRVEVTGSIKFDHVETNRRNTKSEEIRRSFGIEVGEIVFIAGSTQAPEEKFAIETYVALGRDFPALRLIVVPRHQERFDEVARLVEACGLSIVRRSRLLDNAARGFQHRMDASFVSAASASGQDSSTIPKSSGRPVLLLDTLGELSACWGLADIAFVGGSLTNRGGQNMIEPAAYGAALLFGPNTQNFRDVVALLLAHKAATVVHDRDELTTLVRRFLEQPDVARKLGELARELVLHQKGATAKTLAQLNRILPAAKASGREPEAHAA